MWSSNTSEMKIFRCDHILRKRIFVIHLQIEQFFINRAEHFYGNRQIFEFVFRGQNPLLVIFVTTVTVTAGGENSRYGSEKTTADSTISIQTNVHTGSLERKIHLSIMLFTKIFTLLS